MGEGRAYWRQVHEALTDVARRRGELDAEEALLLAEARRCRIHVHLGYASLSEYLDRKLHYEPKSARERLRVADALAALPATTAALRDSSLGWSGVRELTRVATAETEDAWLRAAKGCTCRQVEALVAGHRPGDLPSSPPDEQARRHVLRYEVSPSTLALLREAKLKLVRDAGCALDDDQVLLLMARQVLGEPSDSGRASYQIHLTMCEQCGQAFQQAGADRVELAPEEADAACCDGQLVHGEGKATQTIPPAVRRLVLERAGHRCEVPGCRNCLVDVHHVDWRCEGGGHDPDLLLCCCAAHHAALHRGRLLVEITASGERIFRHADGTSYGGEVDPLEATRRAEVASALCRLGAKHDEAQAATAEAAAHVGRRAGYEGLLKASLSVLRTPGGMRALELPATGTPAAPHSAAIEDAESALRNLGCTPKSARALVAEATAQVGPEAPLEDVLRAALPLLRSSARA